MQTEQKTAQDAAVSGKSERDEDQSSDATMRLEQLRDEIKLHLHLAGMDAKETWHGLEAQLESALRAGSSKAEAANQFAADTRDNLQGALEDLQTRFELFRDSLKKARGH